MIHTPFSILLAQMPSFFTEKKVYEIEASAWWLSTDGLKSKKVLNYLILKKQRKKSVYKRKRRHRIFYFLDRLKKRFSKKRNKKPPQ